MFLLFFATSAVADDVSTLLGTWQGKADSGLELTFVFENKSATYSNCVEGKVLADAFDASYVPISCCYFENQTLPYVVGLHVDWLLYVYYEFNFTAASRIEGNRIFEMIDAPSINGRMTFYAEKEGLSCPTELIYGEHSEQTELLRYIRDNVLAQTPEGREIIKLYYEWSPAIVRAIETDPGMKEDIKEMVDEVMELKQ